MNFLDDLVEKAIKVAILPVAVVSDAVSIIKDEEVTATEELLEDIFEG